jgi:hypothetical protein
MLAAIGFLTPVAALVALAGAVPLLLLLRTGLRADRLRTALGLPAPSRGSRLQMPVAVCAVSGLLGLAAAQPVLRTERPRLARSDAQLLVAIDISRSMLASRSPGGTTRLERAKAAAERLRAGLADVPAGVVTFTDRPLPLLFPTASAAAFDATVERAVGIERPPPRGTALTVTALDALAPIPGTGFFSPRIPHRLLAVVTDGETEAVDADLVRQSFATRPRIGVVVVLVGSRGERVYRPDGLPEAGYTAPAAAPRALAQFLAATHGRSFGAGDPAVVIRAARAALGTGPRTHLGSVASRRDLAPFLVVAAAVPLGVVLRRRNA